MAPQSDTSQRNKAGQSSNIDQPRRNPRFAQFPKAPLKPSPIQASSYEHILLPPQEEEEKKKKPPGQNGGETRYHERKPGMVRFVRNSHVYPKPAVMKPTIARERKTPAAALVSSSGPHTAEDKARQRRRRVSQQMHTTQRPRGPKKKTFKPQLSIKVPSAATAAAESGQRPSSKQWHRVRSILPAGRVPAARAATVRFPLSRESSPEEQIFPSVPTSMHLCFLCRSTSQSEGGLCRNCEMEYARPPRLYDDDDDDDDGEDEEDKEDEEEEGDEMGGIHYPARSYSSSIHSGSSSVYSSDATPINDEAMMVSPVSVRDAEELILLVSPYSTMGMSCVAEHGIQARYDKGHGETDAGSASPDLYDLDWAEYYFNDEYFAGVKGGWGDSLL